MKNSFILFVTMIYLTACSVDSEPIAQPHYLFVAQGKASWYGKSFQGKPTACGELFDTAKLTAAHKTLPFGTRLKVTNLYNNKSVIVRVNDRGPFHGNRILDLSKAAARQVDMIHAGVVEVKIEKLVTTKNKEKE